MSVSHVRVVFFYCLVNQSASAISTDATTMFAFIFILLLLCVLSTLHNSTIEQLSALYMCTLYVYNCTCSIQLLFRLSSLIPMLCDPSIYPTVPFGPHNCVVSFEKSSAVPLSKRYRYDFVCFIDLFVYVRVCGVCVYVIDILNLNLLYLHAQDM